MQSRPPCCALFRALVVLCVIAAATFSTRALLADDPASKEKPANAVVLFDGQDLSKWQMNDGSEAKWKLVDGAMEVNGGDIQTKEKMKGDFLLHVEFMPPNMPEASGQGKGNSGVYVVNSYEVQVLDSFGIEELGLGDCAAIYSKKVPDKNAAKPPAKWQTYDIEFRAPRWDGDKKIENARITVYWNGEKVHDNYEIDSACPGGVEESPEGGVLRLQDHGDPVRYRNIWYAPIEGK